MEPDQAFLESIVTQLVDHPESVKITRETDDRGVLLLLQVHKNDMGKVVGREGQNAKAIRSLLRVIGARTRSHVGLKIEEPEGGTRDTRHILENNKDADFNRENAQEAFGGVATP